MDVASVLTLALLALFLAAQPWSVLAAVLLVTARRWVEEGACLRRRLGLRPRGCRGGDGVGVSGHLAHVDGQPGHAAVELAVGLLLGGWLLWRWRHPKDPGTTSQPSWMGRLDVMSPLLAFGLGAFLPTYAVVVAAVSEMLSSGLTRGWLAAVAAAWVVLASTGVASPLVVLVADRDHAPETYQRWRSWIVGHSRVVLFGVGALVCLVLVGKGIAGLVD